MADAAPAGDTPKRGRRSGRGGGGNEKPCAKRQTACRHAETTGGVPGDAQWRPLGDALFCAGSFEARAIRGDGRGAVRLHGEQEGRRGGGSQPHQAAAEGGRRTGAGRAGTARLRLCAHRAQACPRCNVRRARGGTRKGHRSREFAETRAAGQEACRQGESPMTARALQLRADRPRRGGSATTLNRPQGKL